MAPPNTRCYRWTLVLHGTGCREVLGQRLLGATCTCTTASRTAIRSFEEALFACLWHNALHPWGAVMPAQRVSRDDDTSQQFHLRRGAEFQLLPPPSCSAQWAYQSKTGTVLYWHIANGALWSERRRLEPFGTAVPLFEEVLFACLCRCDLQPWSANTTQWAPKDDDTGECFYAGWCAAPQLLHTMSCSAQWALQSYKSRVYCWQVEKGVLWLASYRPEHRPFQACQAEELLRLPECMRWGAQDMAALPPQLLWGRPWNWSWLEHCALPESNCYRCHHDSRWPSRTYRTHDLWRALGMGIPSVRPWATWAISKGLHPQKCSSNTTSVSYGTLPHHDWDWPYDDYSWNWSTVEWPDTIRRPTSLLANHQSASDPTDKRSFRCDVTALRPLQPAWRTKDEHTSSYLRRDPPPATHGDDRHSACENCTPEAQRLLAVASNGLPGGMHFNDAMYHLSQRHWAAREIHLGLGRRLCSHPHETSTHSWTVRLWGRVSMPYEGGYTFPKYHIGIWTRHGRNQRRTNASATRTTGIYISTSNPLPYTSTGFWWRQSTIWKGSQRCWWYPTRQTN